MEAPPQREVYGEAPPSLLFALTALAAILAVGLLVLAHCVLGLIAIAACSLLAVAFVASTRRGSRRVTAVPIWFHEWQRALYAYRLQRQRAFAIQTLGEATYRGDEAAATWARRQLDAIEFRLRRL